jgi:hypothetical protein
MRFFNTAGPVDCQRHYCLPPLERLKLNQVLPLIEQQKYFVLHAPRQTGKTSSLLALMDYLNAQGQFRCAYVNVEVGQAARENVFEAIRAILGELGVWARITRNDTFIDTCRNDILIRLDREIQIANPIYREVIPRQLTYSTEVMTHQQAAWYLQPDGRLNMTKLLTAFQEFFREHSEHWVERFQYKEAGPQLLLQAFLQRIVNGGGRIEREYGLGRMRTDLLVIWPTPGGIQKVVIELKVLHKTLEQTLATGLEQTWSCLDRCGAEEGHLVIFDRTPDKPWEEKLFQREASSHDHTIQVWGM